MKRPLLLCTLLASTALAAKERSTFRYAAPPDGERPVIVDATVGPQGSDFAMRLRFDKAPWGEECKSRCANATVLLDTDNSKQTGLRLSQNSPVNGADVAIVIQGVRDYAKQEGGAAQSWLRVKIRALSNGASSVDDGELLAEFNHRQDPERLQVDGETIYLLMDATNATLPSARKARVVYQPPGGKPIQAVIAGMIGGGGGKGVRIFKDGSWGKARDAR
ncbi:hypothetical protein [Comamonas sp. JC664]|uniref:hypothetical protein n=1 Tax=Comamonas sp. JC664 TaxID=2801917 RepID=UPI00174C6B16|nr:hypothetical protein [Comamonas sp. JC664]MBL0693868.1 hypothetical protein [Comamonas sp. JC664]GHG74861.1 hypothetical protein GCM10012319_22970 [Comamonas sp. KCTC 72670]